MQIIRNQTPNGQPATPAPKRLRGRDMANAAIRLRVYLGKELRHLAESANLEADHWGAAAVTSLCIALERHGVRGIEPEAECEVVL